MLLGLRGSKGGPLGVRFAALSWLCTTTAALQTLDPCLPWAPASPRNQPSPTTPTHSTTATPCLPPPQAGPLNFYDMGEEQRKQYLDDGLHFTQHGYDQLAGYIANAITSNYVVQRR